MTTTMLVGEHGYEHGLGSHRPANVGSLTESQNRAVLISGLTCACLSLAITMITLRWFILMKRTFRHRLVLLLIASDSFKSIWYFVFPIVVFARGPVLSSSKWCQASGFFLALSIEASDFAILIIAVHSILYIFRPPTRPGGSGGLYKYRHWIYPVWLGLPLLAASLAFVKQDNAYVTAGTFCYLPKRPYWYRLALSWIPRYMIMFAIFAMYIAVYLYVIIKFRSFGNLGNANSSYNMHSDYQRASASESAGESETGEEDLHVPEPAPNKRLSSIRPRGIRGTSYQSSRQGSYQLQKQEPWDAVNFITSRPLQDSGLPALGVQTEDFARLSNSASSDDTKCEEASHHLRFEPVDLNDSTRKVSDVPSSSTGTTGNTATKTGPEVTNPTAAKGTPDPLQKTRSAIRRQLRYLFIYPAVYVAMWAFPFVSHCLLYDDYYVEHPVFWLAVAQTVSLALQSGVDSVIFSWREQPWRRIDANSRLTVPYWHKQGKAMVQRKRNSDPRSASTAGSVRPEPEAAQPSQTTHWWEVEAKGRKESVWDEADLAPTSTRISEGNEPNVREDTILE